MPEFPKREPDIIALLDSMISGYTENPGEFPGANIALLQAKRAAYQTAKDDQIEKQAQAQLATEAKERALAEVKAVMVKQLKQSELDTVDAPEKLGLIHWGREAARATECRARSAAQLRGARAGVRHARLALESPRARDRRTRPHLPHPTPRTTARRRRIRQLGTSGHGA